VLVVAGRRRKLFDFEEGNPAAKEIFENWVKRLRRAVLQKGFAVATASTA
jgi:hypothetical protein